MVELAPNHKIGLTLNAPILAGGGAMGFADEYADLIDFSKLGGFVTNALTLRARTPAEGPRVASFAGGVLMHTGLPNPGVTNAIRDYERKWARLGCPVIVSLAATTPEELNASVSKLEPVESVAGIEIGFREDEPLADAELMLREALSHARQPVIVALPPARALAFARMAEKAGAQALRVAAPRRGTLRVGGEWLTGRLYGPSLFPQSLQLVQEVKKQTSLPLVGAGGVHTQADVAAMLAAGASAVLVESAAWVTGLPL
jgi:dihydroorotate dehydrogenase (NAD+) catalytic subunit